jgi:imidazoleglycerol-phosphate dehydratase/histidinol-phosphatase
MMATAAKIAFLDRDGTLIIEPADEQVDRLDKIALVPGVIAGAAAAARGRLRVRDGHQPGRTGHGELPRGGFPSRAGLRARAVPFAGHRRLPMCLSVRTSRLMAAAVANRNPGILGEAARSLNFDRERSFVAGDRETDLEFARNIGVPGYRVDPTDAACWARIVRELLDQPRTASVLRATRETRIEVSVDLDAEQPVAVHTGIGFFDHMLEQIAKHGGFALSGQLQRRPACRRAPHRRRLALALGAALRQALGDKRGIARYGFVLPMDEAWVQVAIDLSGRACLVFKGKFPRPEVGQLPTEMVPHFFRSLADSAGRQPAHHGTRRQHAPHDRGLLQGLGRTLRQAIARSGQSLPSTKGSL